MKKLIALSLVTLAMAWAAQPAEATFFRSHHGYYPAQPMGTASSQGIWLDLARAALPGIINQFSPIPIQFPGFGGAGGGSGRSLADTPVPAATAERLDGVEKSLKGILDKTRKLLPEGGSKVIGKPKDE